MMGLSDVYNFRNDADKENFRFRNYIRASGERERNCMHQRDGRGDWGEAHITRPWQFRGNVQNICMGTSESESIDCVCFFCDVQREPEWCMPGVCTSIKPGKSEAPVVG